MHKVTKVVALLLMVWLTACASVGKEASIESAQVNIVNAGLLVSDQGKAELGLTLLNTANKPLWVLVHFKTPDGVGDCVLAEELTIAEEQFYPCPQDNMQANVDYDITIEVRRQAAQRDPTEVLSTSMSFTAADIASISG